MGKAIANRIMKNKKIGKIVYQMLIKKNSKAIVNRITNRTITKNPKMAMKRKATKVSRLSRKKSNSTNSNNNEINDSLYFCFTTQYS